jgi:mannosyltransferase OCH1-like enzyme
MVIPKIFFQTSKNKPEQYVVDKILLNCKGWNYIHFDDAEVLQFFRENYIEEFKNIIDKFNSMPTGAHKADLFRYYYLYINGGVFMDSDAMIEMDIEYIIQDNSFVSVISVEPNTIFQGFIGATPKNDIIYLALQDAYHIDIEKLKLCYPLLCQNLWSIIQNNNYSYKIRLLNEIFCNINNIICAVTYNEKNEIVLIHYCIDKKIPNISLIHS